MLPAANRLRSSEDYRRCTRAGSRCGGPLLVVHLHVPTAGRDDAPPPRVGFVVARSVGTAVTRNLVKRRLRHLVRERLGLLPARALVVVRALPAAASASAGELAAELDRCLQRALDRQAGTGQRARLPQDPGAVTP